jgi:hypothetical protein
MPTYDELWYGHRVIPPQSEIDRVLNTPKSEFGPGQPANNQPFGELKPAAPASLREQTEQMLAPFNTNAAKSFAGSREDIGAMDFVPGLGTPSAIGDFMDVRERVKTGEAGPLEYGLTGAGVALSTLPGGVAAKKVLQKGVKYSSKLMDDVLNRTKNVKETPDGLHYASSSRVNNVTGEETKLNQQPHERIIEHSYTKPEYQDNSYVSNLKERFDVTADPISKGQIKSEIVNKGDVMKQDRALMERVLAKQGDKVDPARLARDVDAEVLPLQQTKTSRYADYDTSGKARAGGGKFDTVVYGGPVYHGSDNHFSDPYYFAHTRRQDLGVDDFKDILETASPDHLTVHRTPEGEYHLFDSARGISLGAYGSDRIAQADVTADLKYFQQNMASLREASGVRRVLEIQSDALQKRHNVQAIAKTRHQDPEKMDKIERLRSDLGYLIDDLRRAGDLFNNDALETTGEELHRIARTANITLPDEVFVDGYSKQQLGFTATYLKDKLDDEFNKLEMAAKTDVGFTPADKMLEYQNIWQYRVAREEIKQAAIDGKKEIWFPTGPTASRIENWDDVNNPNRWPARAGHADDAQEGDPIIELDNLGNPVDDVHVPQEGAPGVPHGWDVVGAGTDNTPGVKGTMLTDPEINEHLSRKGNPYANEIDYIQDQLKRDESTLATHKATLEYYTTGPGAAETSEALTKRRQATQRIAQYEEYVNNNKEALKNILEKTGGKDIPESKYFGLYNMYQDLSKWLGKNFKAEQVTDKEGLSWIKVKINPDMATEPVRAFKSVAPVAVGAGAAAAAATMGSGEAQAHHEQSETVQRPDGRWINTYGRAIKGKAGQQLPDTLDYSTVEEAVKAAKQRSEQEGKKGLIKKRDNNESAK